MRETTQVSISLIVLNLSMGSCVVLTQELSDVSNEGTVTVKVTPDMGLRILCTLPVSVDCSLIHPIYYISRRDCRVVVLSGRWRG